MKCLNFFARSASARETFGFISRPALSNVERFIRSPSAAGE